MSLSKSVGCSAFTARMLRIARGGTKPKVPLILDETPAPERVRVLPTRKGAPMNGHGNGEALAFSIAEIGRLWASFARRVAARGIVTFSGESHGLGQTSQRSTQRWLR